MNVRRKLGQVVTMLPSVGVPDPEVAADWLSPVLVAKIRADWHKQELLGNPQQQAQADNLKGKPSPGSDDSCPH